MQPYCYVSTGFDILRLQFLPFWLAVLLVFSLSMVAVFLLPIFSGQFNSIIYSNLIINEHSSLVL